MPIADIHISAVRGVRAELPLRLKGLSLLLKGDNGTGKSSIVRALQWALLGEPSALVGGAGEAGFEGHVLEPKSARRVTVSFDKHTDKIEVTVDSLSAPGKAGEYRTACMRANPFLVRQQLLRFLQDKPIDRFKYLESFLDLDQADRVRDATSKHAAQLSDEAERGATTRDAHLRAISDMIQPELRPLTLTWPAIVRSLGSVARTLKLVSSPGDPTWEQVLALRVVALSLVTDNDLPKRRARLSVALEEAGKLSSEFESEALPDIRSTATRGKLDFLCL